MRQYIALIHKEPDSDYGVSFPDLPGVISAGKTLDEARDMGAEALALHLEGLAADGEAAPEPSSLEEIMKDAQNKDGVAVLIAAPAADVKSVRINVTMPADVLDQSDSLPGGSENFFGRRCGEDVAIGMSKHLLVAAHLLVARKVSPRSELGFGRRCRRHDRGSVCQSATSR